MKNLMSKLLCFLILFLFVPQGAVAFDAWFSSGARSFALGNIRAVGDEWLNPAGLSFAEERQFGLSVLDRFRISELGTAELTLAWPNRRLDAGFRFTSFGYADYRIAQLQGNFSKKVFRDCSIGLQVNYRNLHSRWEEASKNGYSVGLGLYYRLDERVDLALLGEHLLRFSEMETARWQAGVEYRMTTSLAFFGEISTDRTMRIALGADYTLSESLHIRSGYDTERGMPAFGLGYGWNRWRVDAGFALHSVLGISSLIAVKYTL